MNVRGGVLNASRVGIFGGTFNPPHLGHLIVAQEVRRRFSLDKIVFVPSARPPHKADSPGASSAERYIMTVLATRDNPYFEVSDVEIRRPGRSYTVDTIKQFKKLYGTEVEIFFIMGGDSIFEIDTWREPEEILRLCKVIVTTRPGFDLTKVEDRLKEKAILTEVSRIDISSTEIRRRVQEGKSIKYLVPKEVEEYILREKLYR
ncbi:MAG: nicotinate-nucleotide adenylyltransferase [bacterium]